MKQQIAIVVAAISFGIPTAAVSRNFNNLNSQEAKILCSYIPQCVEDKKKEEEYRKNSRIRQYEMSRAVALEYDRMAEIRKQEKLRDESLLKLQEAVKTINILKKE